MTDLHRMPGHSYVRALESKQTISALVCKLKDVKKREALDNVIRELQPFIIDYNEAVVLSKDKNLKQTSLKEELLHVLECSLDGDYEPYKKPINVEQYLKKLIDGLNC